MYFFQIKILATVKDKDMLINKPRHPPNKKEYLWQIRKGIKNRRKEGLRLTVMPTKKPLRILLNFDGWLRKNQAIDSRKT